MTKKLEEIFNLEENEKKSKQSLDQIKTIDQSLAEVDSISKSLPVIPELESADESELDELAQKSKEAYDDLMDLGMNVEVRYAGRIFEVAGTMMKNAIDAKSAKIDKRLKAVDLQLKKYKIDKDSSNSDQDGLINGEGYVITDRNELLKKLGQKE